MSDQRGLAESIDLGLGPVRSRRGPLGAGRAEVLDHLARGAGRRMTLRRSIRRPDVVDAVRDRLAREPGALTPHRVAEALRETGRPVGDATVLAVHETLRRDVVGAGPLEPLLRTPGVTDVLVNGAGRGLPRPRCGPGADRRSGSPTTRPCAGSPSGWRRSGGRRLDDATPYVDVRLRRRHPLPRRARAGGRARHPGLAAGAATARLHARRAGRRPHPDRRGRPAAPRGRRPRGSPSWSAAAPARARPRCSRRCCSAGRPGRAAGARRGRRRAAPRPTRTSSRSRRGPPNIEGAGEITLRTLVRQALRMRPDRLVVGEVRGGEVVELLAALNTGHEGGCGTLHANSAGDVPARIEALALAAGLGRDAGAQPARLRRRRRAPPRPRGPTAAGCCARSRCRRAAPTGWSRCAPAVEFGRRRRRT